MSEIKVNISDANLDKKIRIYMAVNDLSSKEKAILDILEKELGVEKSPRGKSIQNE